MENNEQQCCICSNRAALLEVQDKWICEKCLHMGIEKLITPWKESVEALLKEYSEVCYQCLSDDQPEYVHQARIIGRKIQAVLEFIGLPKNHDLLLAVKKVHRILTKVREADVLLVEMKKKSEENIVYTQMVKALTKKQQKQQKLIAKKIPAIINDSFNQTVETFINHELVSYIVPIEKENVLLQYEESFNRLVEAYHQSVEEKGKTKDATVKTLHAIRKKSKSLRYIYNYINETFGDKYQDQESFYKNLQSQFGDINDAEDWLFQIKAYEEKIKAPKRDIDDVKKELKARLQNLLEDVEFLEAPIKEM